MAPRAPSGPGGFFAMISAARRAQVKLPVRLMSSVRRKLSSRCGPSRPSVRAAVAMPAQATSASSRPVAPTTSERPAATEASSVTSTGMNRRLFAPRGVAVEEDDGRPGLGQTACGRKAKTRGPAGDDRDRAGQLHRVSG